MLRPALCALVCFWDLSWTWQRHLAVGLYCKVTLVCLSYLHWGCPVTKHAASQPADWRQPSDVKPYELSVRMMAQSLGLFAFGAFFAGFLNTKSHADDSKYSNFCLNLEALTHVPKKKKCAKLSSIFWTTFNLRSWPVLAFSIAIASSTSVSFSTAQCYSSSRSFAISECLQSHLAEVLRSGCVVQTGHLLWKWHN